MTEPFRKVAASPKSIEVPDLSKPPRKGVQPTKSVAVKQRFERTNPKTKENPNGHPKVFVVVEGGDVFILAGEKRDQWQRLGEVPPSIAAMVEK